MSRPRDERGRFVRADAQPVLHRQVPEPCAHTAEWLQLTAPRETERADRWPWVFFALGLLLVMCMGLFLMGARP